MARTQRQALNSILVALAVVAAAVGVAMAARALSQADVSADLSGGRMPSVAYDAYLVAASAAPSIAAGCEVDWTVLAGLAWVESRHGQVDMPRQIEPDGEVTPWIRGPRLDGDDGMEDITDSDGGELDGDPTWDRAMGPFQFIPTTWAELGRDGNGDGVADPDNVYDAALTAAAHLCLREPGNYSDRSELRRALVAYNPSGRYADEVLAWIDRYQRRPLDQLLLDPSPSGEPEPAGS